MCRVNLAVILGAGRWWQANVMCPAEVPQVTGSCLLRNCLARRRGRNDGRRAGGSRRRWGGADDYGVIGSRCSPSGSDSRQCPVLNSPCPVPDVSRVCEGPPAESRDGDWGALPGAAARSSVDWSYLRPKRVVASGREQYVCEHAQATRTITSTSANMSARTGTNTREDAFQRETGAAPIAERFCRCAGSRLPAGPRHLI